MNEQITPSSSRFGWVPPQKSGLGAVVKPPMVKEVLPFTVRIVANEEDLDKAVRIRHSAYARHVPQIAETLKYPEALDADPGVVVLLAESKLDNSALGTMRIQSNQFKPLCLEQSIALPAWMKPLRLAEATRLGVTDGKFGRLITTVLFKSYYLYCKRIGIEWMVIAGRSPIDRQYERMLFTDVFPGTGYVPLIHAGNLPHRVMSSNVETAEERWTAAKHPLYDFAFRTHHPDIYFDTEQALDFSSMSHASIPPQSASFSM